MKYLSTRGGDERLSFEDVVLSGLAPDGGLYIPEEIPKLPQDWESKWSTLSFVELALEIYSLFIPNEEIDRNDLKELIIRSYSTFSHPEIAPIKKLDQNLFLLELWHGPTFAFKDVALQFLGNLFEFFLNRQNQSLKSPRRMTVLGATSGDTGSAAIYGLRGKKNISIFILHPHGRVSPIQAAQMTTVTDPNVFNIALSGTFDDCQEIVKNLFNDVPFNSKYRLGAINSINWARILAQIVYYFSSYFKLKPTLEASNQKLQFVVPTGNFGDILAGFYANRLGLPIGFKGESPGLVIATNSNDILTRFWETGRYEKSDSSVSSAQDDSGSLQTDPVGGCSTDGKQAKKNFVKATLSPAMDILVSSNFERLLFYLALESDSSVSNETDQKKKTEKAQAKVNEWMKELKLKGSFKVEDKTLGLARQWFGAGRANDLETSEIIKEYYSRKLQNGDSEGGERYLVDPHTAVGLKVAKTFQKTNSSEIVQVVLSTAHPAKFIESIEKSINVKPSEDDRFDSDSILPDQFKGILDLPKKLIRVNDTLVSSIKEVVEVEVSKLFGKIDLDEGSDSKNLKSI